MSQCTDVSNCYYACIVYTVQMKLLQPLKLAFLTDSYFPHDQDSNAMTSTLDGSNPLKVQGLLRAPTTKCVV